MRKEEGATVAATPYLLLSKTVRAVSTVGPDGQYRGSPIHREILIKYQKRPNYETPAIFRHSSSLTLQNR
jgi:hypothetical protein